MSRPDEAAGHLMLAFEGTTVPDWVTARVASRPPAGFTLFSRLNVESPAQVRLLTAALQDARPDGAPPMLIATDQEGGQLQALGDGTTAFAGNMALGAADDPELARSVGKAIGREVRALGVTVDYAPALDLASEPLNPGIGIRSFGDDPRRSASLAAAFVDGLQSEGVAATAKHFPGVGASIADTHHGGAFVPGDRERLRGHELVPFRATIDAGARLVMSAHAAVPAVGGRDDLPATLSREVMSDLLREELGFHGVTITDALDMKALAQGAAQAIDVVAAIHAGADLLLCTADREAQDRAEHALGQAIDRELIEPARLAASRDRVGALRRWTATFEHPPLEVVGCAEHLALARRLAEASVTLLRDDDAVLPLRPGADDTVLTIQPLPTDLTPADTSSTVPALLAEAVRQQHQRVRDIVTPLRPGPGDVAAVEAAAGHSSLVIVGTYAAHLHPEQSALVHAILGTGVPTVTVALRTPWDLAAYPAARTHALTYGIVGPQLEALAAALFGRIPFCGRSPVELRP